MNFKNIFKLAFSNLKIHKSTTIKNVMMFVFSLEILLISSIFSDVVKNEIESMQDESLMHIATATFSGEGSKERFQEFYDSYANDSRIDEIGEGKITGYACEFLNAQELFGVEYRVGANAHRYLDYYKQYTDYDKDLKKGEVLLPKYINLTKDGWYDYFDVGEFYDTSELIGKTISINVGYTGVLDIESKYEKVDTSIAIMELKIVGVLDNAAMGQSGQDIYVSKETMDEFDDIWEDKGINEEVYNMYIVVEDMKDMESIKDEHIFTPYAEFVPEVDDWKYMMDAVNIMGKVLFVFSTINLILSVIKGITKRMSEIAIMRAVGYEQSIIYKMLACEVTFTFAMGFVISMILTLIVLGALNIIKYSILPIIYAERYVFSLEPWHILVSVAVVLFGTIIAYGFSMDKLTKTNLLKSLKNK